MLKSLTERLQAGSQHGVGSIVKPGCSCQREPRTIPVGGELAS